ncbi:Hypoxia sensor histidine kinase response regulator DosT [bacterium HR23]|nr:Hypoxia sensor histidine kinase response regulator DosT [bacterium HR23]
MTLRHLRWIGFGLPAVFLVALEALRYFLLAQWWPPYLEHIVSAGIVVAGAFLFSYTIFRVIERMERRILEQKSQLEELHRQAQQRSAQLAALPQAGIHMTSELSIEAVLQKVVDLAREVAGARYGALAVRDDEGNIEHFITSGLSEEERRRIGSPPTGRGILGIPLETGKPLRLRDLTQHPRSAGFPPHHPVMHSFLGVPIVYKGRALGQLYLTEKEGAPEFTPADEEVMVLFANQAAVAIENARLYERVKTLAVLEDRERIARDLHDSIIQSIYAVGLSLENTVEVLEEAPQEARERLNYAVDKLNDIIRDIRNFIFNLRPQVYRGKTLARGLEELVAELQLNTLMDVDLLVQEGIDRLLTPEQTATLLQIAREGLTNIIKHARARSVRVVTQVANGSLLLRIEDDGVGFDPNAPRSAERQGLRNMHARTLSLGGDLQIESQPGHGTRLVVRVPLGVLAQA